MWGNRQVLHRAPRDIIGSDFPRIMHRITLVGEVPVGVDGRESTVIEGEKIQAVCAA